jgi:hypothetical protein
VFAEAAPAFLWSITIAPLMMRFFIFTEGVTALAVDTAVTKPLALTVITGIELEPPNEPVLLFTVANVSALVPAVLEASPEKAGSLAALRVPLVIAPVSIKLHEVLVPFVVKYLPELPV